MTTTRLRAGALAALALCISSAAASLIMLDALAAEKTDKEQIQGAWLIVSAERDGKVETVDDTPGGMRLKLVITPDWFVYKLGDVSRGAFYKIDPAKKTIETDDLESKEGKPARGIYALDGDTLKICTSTGDPPAEFKTKPGSGAILLVLKREPAGTAKEPKPSGAAARMRSASNLRQIGIALHNYHNDYGALPPPAIMSKDGKPLLSWRVAILPYIEQGNLHQQFKLDEPWDSPHNKRLIARMPKIYAPLGGDAKDPFSTYYQVFTGKGTIFEEGGKGTKFPDITDGTSNTILAVEGGEPAPWTKPVDLPYDDQKALPKLGGMLNGGFNVLLGDGSVRFVKAKFNEKTLRALITRNGGEVANFDEVDR